MGAGADPQDGAASMRPRLITAENGNMVDVSTYPEAVLQ